MMAVEAEELSSLQMEEAGAVAEKSRLMEAEEMSEKCLWVAE